MSSLLKSTDLWNSWGWFNNHDCFVSALEKTDIIVNGPTEKSLKRLFIIINLVKLNNGSPFL